MTRAWRIYFGAVAAVFVCGSGMALLVTANERSVEAAMQVSAARGQTPTFNLATNPGRGFNVERVKPRMGDYTPLNSAFP